jgi:16S rRNA (adenine1518-N6/adenine1519-N6)-dimethyltransferase
MFTPRAVQEELAEEQIRPSKALGQNFVCDKNTVDKILSLADLSKDRKVIEIGPGLGALTFPLAELSSHVLAVEKDLRLAERLAKSLPASVKVLARDALDVDWDRLCAMGWSDICGLPLMGRDPPSESLDIADNQTWALVANLPYNIAAQLIISVLEQTERITDMLVMVQKEVGMRLSAKAGSRDYGISTLKLSYFAEAKLAGKVSREIFFPKPNIDSVLIKIKRRPPEEIRTDFADYKVISYLAVKAFSQRRKMLRHSLKNLLSDSAYAEASVLPSARPEELDINAWSRLAKCYNY